VAKPERMRQPGKPRHRWVDNIKMYPRVIKYCGGLIWLNAGKAGELS
jgi:hypothetical protein